ncbi:exonuclease domain-containing protein [Pontibacter amylolyticus]|uniref:DNA polymerase III subunit epsilon n=1 Tax=Pontibacter amylolyticus TaxID=1424080 RepID=A0ABQ1WBS9_9BACT|nr:exonuclease domain-containing protein [Pontibacter amylolyticus]GGG21995.1 DNA polymerase III subunit epsilon [Pontibacter amylolyticus]
MDFITIDFETATSQRESPCEIGLTFIKANRIVETKSWLIKPVGNQFDEFNISLHGITPKMVANAPEFNSLWSEIHPLLENQFLIAHNASFDFSVLRRTLDLYNLPFPNLDYACSYIFSKHVWEGLPSYGLAALCKANSIPLDHHRAAADSLATAELSLKAFDLKGVNSLKCFPEKLKTVIGKIHSDGYRPCETKNIRTRTDFKNIVDDPDKHDPSNFFYGKRIVFTGTLTSMQRKDAIQLVADIGGIPDAGVTKKTNVLVVGQQDYRVVGDDGMSSKQEKAVGLLEKGADIEIISEYEFFQNL